MPPFRRRNYYRRWWNWRRPRTYFRRRRPRKTFFTRKRRRRRVRRKRFYKLRRKNKTVRIQQWQPTSIKKCKIQGYLCMFQAGPGRYSNNYALWKESFFPQHYPGGGGWSIQQLSLGILFKEHTDQMNYWTKSNDRMNLCRYMGCSIQMFREPFTDWVFYYFDNLPKTVSKWFYSSQHPIRLLNSKRKRTIPSFQTQPHKRKPYKSIFIPPPKLMKNQWFFQSNLADYPLLTFAASAVSLTGMFGGTKAISNNATFYCLDTKQFTTPNFQWRQSTPPQQWGYTYGTNFLYGLERPYETWTQNKKGDGIYLGNTMYQQSGIPMRHRQENNYTYKDWGNPFFWEYASGDAALFTDTKNPNEIITTQKDTSLSEGQKKTSHYIFKARYNPFHDKGKGNVVYFIPTYDRSKTDWEPTSDPDIKWENQPLWLTMWGLEDILKRMGKCTNLDMDWVMVVKSSYILPPERHYVFLSYDFVHGRGPYDTEKEFMTTDDLTHWYPRFKYQRQALDNLVKTGPAVATGDNVQNIQAKIKYTFFFKWGGNSEPQETVRDPNSQPITPSPNYFDLSNEIIDPSTDITTEIYPWDFRRDILTTTATERIKQIKTNEQTMFTDGRQTTTDLPLQTETQKKKTPETQEEALLQQLNQLQQYNLQLQHRLRNLKQLSMDL
nr:MAG: ORF1 [TTV-like mini virus]